MSTDDRRADYLDPNAEDLPLSDAEQRALDAVRRTLSDPLTWDEPPLDLADRLLSLASTTPQDGARPARSGRRGFLIAAGSAAAAAAVFAGVVPRIAQQPAREQYRLAGTALAPTASATVDVESKSAGDAITLHITGLDPAPAGSYYAGWLTGPTGTVPVGSFHWRRGGIPIELWSGVDTHEYPNFEITLQRDDQPPAPSGAVVLRGSLQR
jgi:hypothetical protein